MATVAVQMCDKRGSACRGSVRSFTLWRADDRQAVAVDLCEAHAKPIVAVLEIGRLVDLPTRPRARMERTALRTTAKTAALKKAKHGQESPSKRSHEEDQTQA